MNKPKKKTYYRWTEREVEYLKEHYPTTTAAQIGKALYRSSNSVRIKARALGVKSEVLKVNNKGRFKKGDRPWNYGLKNKYGYNNITGIASTRFKKGNKPHNTRELGEIWIRTEQGRKYKFTKSERGIERLSHYLYRMHYKKEVPKHHVIRYKDGDAMNCTIENMMCISKAENAAMNANYKKTAKTRIIKEAGGYLNAVLMCKI